MDCLAGSQLMDLLNGSASTELAADIDAHVDECAECRELLVNLARGLSASSRPRSLRTDSPTQERLLLGDNAASVSRRYRILGLVGEGGMGRVYRAFDRLLGIEVALKQLVLLSPQDLHLGTLAEEFRTLCTLHHPNIVRVFDYGFDSQGQPFYTMELLHDAQPLLSFAQGRPAEAQLELVVQLLHAVAYLHRHGVVHRDLTPGNVLVVMRDEGAVVKLVDFGLAQDVAHGNGASVAGTLPYMAPELFRGEPASERSDLYAVGVMAYQMLTGSYPFPVERGAAKLLNDILVATPDLSPLSPALRPVLGRVLHKAPTHRQADAAALLRELLAAAALPLKNEPVATRDSYLLAARFVGRHAELRQIQMALDAARHGDGSAWIVSGESGVGKSRLLEELRRGALASGILTLRGQAMPGGAVYHVWQDVLKLLALQVPLSELQASTLCAILPDLPTLIEREVDAPQGLDPSSARLRLFHIVEELLAQLPETALVLLEDLQWADAESLALLSQLASGISARALLIVATYREEEAHGLSDALPALRKLRLPRLNRFEIAALCESMLGQAGRDRALLDLVEAETEGNAYFIVEGMRALAAETGSLASIGRGGLPQRLLTGGIEQVLMRHIARAPVSARPLLCLSAVAGRELDLALLSRLLPQAEVHVHELADVGILELYDQRWRFGHDKLRERVRDSLSAAERQQLHASIALGLQQLYPDDPGRASQIAIHYREAKEPAKAARFYALAGDAALRHGAPKEAAALLEQARSLHAQIQMPRLAEVQLWRGITEARFGIGRLRESEAALRQLCALAGTPLPTEPLPLYSMMGRLAAELLGRRMGLWPRKASTDPAQRAMEAELLAGLGVEEVFVWTDQPELGLLCTLLGMSLEDRLGMAPRRNYHRTALFFILSHTPLRGLCLRYMEHIERRDADILSGTHAEIDFLRVRAMVELNDGQLHRAVEHAAKAVALSRAYKDDLALLHSLLQLQLAAAGLDDYPQMLAVSREMEPLAVRAENARYLALAYVGQGAAQLSLGEYEASAAILKKAHACLPQELGPVPESVILGLLASACRHLNQFERAIEFASHALDAVLRARWSLEPLRHPLVCLLDVLLASPEPVRHKKQIETALAKLQQLARRFPSAAPDDAMFHALYFWRFDRPRQAIHSFRQCIALANQLGMTREKALAQYWLGCFAQTPAGRPLVSEGAAPHFRDALATSERIKAAGMSAMIRAAWQSSATKQ